MKLRYK